MNQPDDYTALVKQYGIAIAREEAPLAALRSAILEAFGTIEGHEPDVARLADAEGIPLKDDFADLAQYTALARKEAADKLARVKALEEARAARGILDEYAVNLEAGNLPSDPKMIDAAGRIADQLADLAAPEAAAIRPAVFADYFNARITWKPERDFRPHLFKELPFPPGTVSYIGARTARGKSAVLVNLAREALLQGRRALYVSLELSPSQIFDRLILSTAKASHPTLDAPEEILRTLYGVMRNYSAELIHEGKSPFADAMVNAMGSIRGDSEAGKLAVLDVRGSNLAAILAAIRERTEENDLVLLDYIQRLPASERNGAATEGWERMKAVSDEVVNTATARNVVLIAAAQFNRVGSATKDTDDTFTEANFRESGDIEQDAHNAIGIGWKSDKKTRFYEILKAREAAGTGDAFELEWSGAFQYMAATKEHYQPPTPPIKTPRRAPPKNDGKTAAAVKRGSPR